MCKVAYILLPYRSRIYVLFKAIFFILFKRRKIKWLETIDL
nr:MAG TPA: hypothetical protein [Caudoviricetes sp.]